MTSPQISPEQAKLILDRAMPTLKAEHETTKRVIEAIPLDKGDYRPDAVSGPEWQGRSLWLVRRPILSADHVAMEHLRLDGVIAIDCSVRSGCSGCGDEYVHGTGCYVWRSR